MNAVLLKKRNLPWIMIMVIMTAACNASAPYILGTGFYSENYSKTQVQAAANSGKMKFLGRFTEDGTSCGNYTMDTTDNNLVLPVVKDQLRKLGGNAADNIVVKWNMQDVAFACLIAPVIAGCRSYTVSGEAMLVQP